ncbi:hypothetical protein B566_EDAN013773 [Ephemera danica]|nr:hypothetical protein B566_EDAN013773 [Ephemera danica]
MHLRGCHGLRLALQLHPRSVWTSVDLGDVLEGCWPLHASGGQPQLGRRTAIVTVCWDARTSRCCIIWARAAAGLGTWRT